MSNNLIKNVNISVVLPVYNGKATLSDALLSVLEQKVSNTEVILIDDGSHDSSVRIAEDISKSFPFENIKIHRQENKGLAASLNVGISIAKGKFIARLDQDDLVLPKRFIKQFDYLEKNSQTAMVGTRAQIYEGDKASERYHNHALSSNALKLELLFDNPFVHSSVMLRKSVLEECGGYSEDISRQPPEDYELWSRIAQKYDVANLSEVLTIYREMPSSMSRTGINPFLNNVLKISAENIFFRLSSDYSFDQCLRLAKIYHGVELTSKEHLSNRIVQKMLKQAAINIAGAENYWSDEYREVFRRMSKHLKYRSISKSLPEIVLMLLRIAKSFFRKLT
jgi:glycosyltransferase involved in cell wall biosynthesis